MTRLRPGAVARNGRPVRSGDAARDAGLGLPELLVAMAVFTVVLGAVGAVVIGSLDSVRSSMTKTRSTADSRIAMEAATRALRVAVPPGDGQAAITTATSSSVTFYASLSRGAAQTAERPTRVTLGSGTVGGRTCVTETQVTALDNTGADRLTRPLVWTGAGTTRCLAETSSPPAFAYYDTGLIDGAGGTPVTPLAVPTGGLDAAARATVVSVGVTVEVRAPGARATSGVFATDRVALTNVAAAAGLRAAG